MTYLFTITLSLLTLLSAFGQQPVQRSGQSNSHIYGESFNARVREIPFTPGETEGSFYLFDAWSPGKITMRNQELVQDVFLKYSFQKKALEIKTDSGYYSLDVADTKGFLIYDDNQHVFRQFVTAQDFREDGTPLSGALEMLHQDSIGLVAQVAPKLIEANYKGALSGGSTSDKIVKDKEYFLVDGDQLIALPTKKKKAIEVLQQYDPDIQSFMKDQHLKPKREEDLVAIVEHLNS